MKNKNNKNMLKGSITIEASIIMPIIIIIVALLVYLSFFLYNRCIITQMTYISALRGSLSEENLARVEQSIQIEEKELFSNKVLAIAKIQFDNEIKNKNITLTTNASMRFPFASYASQLKIKGNWNIIIKKNVEKIDALQFIRNCRKLDGLLEKNSIQ